MSPLKLFSIHWPAHSAPWLWIPSSLCCTLTWTQSLSIVIVLTTITIVLNTIVIVLNNCQTNFSLTRQTYNYMSLNLIHLNYRGQELPRLVGNTASISKLSHHNAEPSQIYFTFYSNGNIFPLHCTKQRKCEVPFNFYVLFWSCLDLSI